MATLAEYQLSLPYAEWKSRDWKTAIKEATGFRKRILQILEVASFAVAGVDTDPLTPQKLAWSVLWARCFVLLQSAADLYGAYSVRVADTLHRIAFELSVQVDAIRQPWDQLHKLQAESERLSVSEAAFSRAWDEVSDRLRGFAAWALTNDLVYHRNRNRRWELEAIHQPTKPSHVPKTPEEAALLRYLYGEWEVISEAEALFDLSRTREYHASQASRISAWLTDPAFGPWVSERLRPWINGSSSDPLPSFFRLLDPAADTMQKAFDKLGIRHLYGAYTRGSMMLHGSSITHFINVAPANSTGVIIPMVLESEEDGEVLCSRLSETAHLAMLGLLGIRDHCL